MRATWWLVSIADEVEFESSLNEVEWLGSTPSELEHHRTILAEQGWPWVGHQGCPEMDLSNVVAE